VSKKTRSVGFKRLRKGGLAQSAPESSLRSQKNLLDKNKHHPKKGKATESRRPEVPMGKSVAASRKWGDCKVEKKSSQRRSDKRRFP